MIENLPSPPILSLYRDYLPLLVGQSGNEEEVILPSEQVLENLRKGVTIRNRIIHLGDPAPDYDTVEKILTSVVDLLWIIDSNSENEWAMHHIGELEKLTGRAY